MELGELLVKIAKKQTLSQFEVEFLRNMGRQIQQNNAFVSGLQNGQSEIKASKISSLSGFFTELTSIGSVLSERTITLTATQSMPNNSFSGMYGYAEVINDGYVYKVDGRIHVPADGTYACSASYTFDDSASSSGTRAGYVLTDSGYTSIRKDVVPVSGTPTNFTINGQINLVGADSFRFIVFQNSGAAMNVTLRVTIRKIR